MSVATVERSQDRPAEAVARVVGLVAEFDSVDAIKAAAARVRDAGYTRFDAHTPFPVHGIDACIGIRPTRLPILVFACGALGCLTGILLTWWTNATSFENFSGVPTFLQGYNYNISGKPAWSFPANIPPIFELTILFSALAAVFGMLVLNNLPLFHQPVLAISRFARVTSDRFFISIDASDPRFRIADTQKLLESAGAHGVETVRELPGSDAPPAFLKHVNLVAALLAIIPLALIWMARNNKSDKPRIHIIQDMDNQERFKYQQATALFADGRASRPRVAGAVARGDNQEDSHYWHGLVNGDYATTFPTHDPRIRISEEFIRRGQQRFEVYCAPCHGYDGRGTGAVNARAVELANANGAGPGGAWVTAQDLHDADRKARPVGNLFNTITNGVRTMPSYGDQIPVEDRWAIVAYVKALQRSTSGTLDDLPADQRSEMLQRK